MHRYFLIVLLLFSFIIPIRREWSSTPIDSFFDSNFNKMIFRKPIYLIPYDLKVGFLNYGGPGYFNQAIQGNYDLNSNPILLDNQDINNDFISSPSSRNGLFIELDIMKYNLLERFFHQNLIDCHIGTGFRLSKMLSNPKGPIYGDAQNKGYRFRPTIYDSFINTTLTMQFSPKFFFYSYYSFGLSYASIYESLGQQAYINGSGFNENISLGYKYIIEQESLPYDYTIGLELRLGRTYINKINDIDDVSPIIGLDMNNIAFFLTFGTLFGGESTKGDQAYKLMLEKNYIAASIKYKQFLNVYTDDFRHDEAKNMLNFCYTQIPYQYFDIGLDFFNKKDYLQALINFDKAEQIADSELILEIESYKRDIALDMINNIDSKINKVSFSESIKALNQTRQISPYLWYEADKVEAKILIKKGDVLNEIDNYLYAIDYYQQALDLDPSLFEEINNRYSNLVISIINDVNNINSFDELNLIKEYLKIIIDLKPQYYNSYYPFIIEIEKKLKNYNRTINIINLKNYVQKKRIKEQSRLSQDIKIGMTIHEVEAILGIPTSIEKESDYELWIYQNNSLSTIYFFKDYILMKVN
ncbi:hypothetical protein OAI93_02480 [bacterium]|nr:hypothetical protein [bacterium]